MFSESSECAMELKALNCSSDNSIYGMRGTKEASTVTPNEEERRALHS